jgi:hypothetical protein
MARLRLLFALFLVAVGTTFGAFALSGYYQPAVRSDQPKAAAVARTVSPDGWHFMRAHMRQRVVAVSEDAAASAKPKVAKIAAKSPPMATKRPQKAPAPWPWSLFSN